MRIVATGDECPEHSAQHSERQSDHGRIDQRPQRVLAEIGGADQGEPEGRDQPQSQSADHATRVETAPEQRKRQYREVAVAAMQIARITNTATLTPSARMPNRVATIPTAIAVIRAASTWSRSRTLPFLSD